MEAGREDPSPSLEQQLAAAREEAQQNHERWIRERADLENVKKRHARELADALKYGGERLLRDLLPMVDNLERAVQAAEGGGNGQSLAEGIAMVVKGINDVLQRHGISRVPAHGHAFDPTHHEAVAHVESEAHPPNVVMEEHQAGYRYHDRLLRPALVTVAKAPPGSSSSGNLADDESGD